MGDHIEGVADTQRLGVRVRVLQRFSSVYSSQDWDLDLLHSGHAPSSRLLSDVQCQKAVAAYFSSKHCLLAFAGWCSGCHIIHCYMSLPHTQERGENGVGIYDVHGYTTSCKIRLSCRLFGDFSRPISSKHETLTQCWANVGPLSTTLAQHWVGVSCFLGQHAILQSGQAY